MRYSVVLCAALLGGCAGMGQSSFSYTPPKEVEVQNSAIINDGFEQTWNRLIANLSKQYFVINNVEKASRIINVSFSTDDPMKYIDCGVTERTFEPGPGAGQPEFFNYPSAISHTKYKATTPNPQAPNFTIPILVERRTKLEGRTNIYLAPKEGDSEISVNTRYIFTPSVTASTLAYGGTNTQVLDSVTFNTGNEGRSSEGMKCLSKGIIEQDIIKAASPR